MLIAVPYTQNCLVVHRLVVNECSALVDIDSAILPHPARCAVAAVFRSFNRWVVSRIDANAVIFARRLSVKHPRCIFDQVQALIDVITRAVRTHLLSPVRPVATASVVAPGTSAGQHARARVEAFRIGPTRVLIAFTHNDHARAVVLPARALV